MPYSGAPISVVDSFQVWFGENFSRAPISVVDSFQVTIRRAYRTFDLTIAGKTYNLPFAKFRFPGHAAFELDTPKYGAKRGAPRSRPQVTIAGEWMPERVADAIRAARRIAAAPILVTFVDEAEMAWSAILTDAEFDPVLGTIHVNYKLSVILLGAPSTIRAICS